MTLGTDPVVLDTTGETSPYPYFEYMRRTDPVWHGSHHGPIADAGGAAAQ